MFLFKKIKSNIIRLGLNIFLYSCFLAIIDFIIAMVYPSPIPKILITLLLLFCFIACVGLFLVLVGIIVSFIKGLVSKKSKHIPKTNKQQSSETIRTPKEKNNTKPSETNHILSDSIDDNTDKQIMKVENYVENYIEATLKKGEYKGYPYPQSKSEMSCKECGKHLRAFRYYRDNTCWTYCEECGKPYQANHAAPYKTIELMFSGNQGRGYGLAIEIENWPSLVCGSLRYEEWECLGILCGGYGADRVDLPSNYIAEHTVDEFIDEYIMKDNKAINHISDFINEEFLNMTRTILMESGIFKQPKQIVSDSIDGMNYKKLFISADLDYCHQAAVIVDLDTYQFYNALFSEIQISGLSGDFHIEKVGNPISCEQVKLLAEKSKDRSASKFLEITNDNWKEVIMPIQTKNDVSLNSKDTFMNNTIALMVNFLKSVNYDITFCDTCMTIVKHKDDPWNHFNKFIAKPDGVYNYVEVQMGGYDEKKRVSCCNFDTACFLTLAMFISREKLPIQKALLLEIKQHADTVVKNSSDYWGGQFIIDELVSLVK